MKIFQNGLYVMPSRLHGTEGKPIQ